jgi:hypothetical protein
MTSIMVEFIAIVSLIAGILQIILFFKVWGMTNDIRELKKDHFCETDIETYYQKATFARKNLVLGRKEQVKSMLLKNFIHNIEQNYINNEQSLRPYVDNLKAQFEKIGEELPEYIDKMETFGDYYQLFSKDDFKVEKEKN